MTKLFTTLGLAAALAVPAMAQSYMPYAQVVNPAGEYNYFFDGLTITWGEVVKPVEGAGKPILKFNGTVQNDVLVTVDFTMGGNSSGGRALLGTRDDDMDDESGEVPEEQGTLVGINYSNLDVPWPTDVIVTIPEGMVQNLNGTPNQEQNFQFFIRAGFASDYAVVTPNPYEENNPTFSSTDLSRVTVAWEGATSVTYNSSLAPYLVAASGEVVDDPDNPTGGGGNEIPLVMGTNFNIEGGVIVFNLESVIKTPDTYNLIIPIGTFLFEGTGDNFSMWSQRINSFFQVAYKVTQVAGSDNPGQPDQPFEVPEVVALPGSGVVESLSSIALNWGGYMLSVNPALNGLISFTKDGEISNIPFTASVVDLDEFVIEFSQEITEPGTYILNLPEGYILVSNGTQQGSSEEVTLTYIIEGDDDGNGDDDGDGDTTGVGSITVEGAKIIYDLNGNRVNEKDAKKGIYIINGNKVLVK